MRRILSGHLGNKGVTLITLIIAITIFAIFITVFSYVMVAKHGSSALYVQSTQAYAIAQAGIEYGIRYAADQYIIDPTYDYAELADPDFYRDLGSGSGSGNFALVYTPATTSDPNILTSTGTVGVATRKIILQCFSGFVLAAVSATTGDPFPAIGLDPSDPPYET